MACWRDCADGHDVIAYRFRAGAVAALRPFLLLALLFAAAWPSVSRAEDLQDLVLIKSIEINGLKRTKPRVIRRNLPFSEGDIWQSGDAKTGERRLLNLGLFSMAHISPPDEKGVVRIRVKERWPFFLLPEGSRQDTGKTSVGLALTDHNLWGLNHNLRLAIREDTGKNFSGLSGTSYQGNYLWRRIGDGPVNLAVSFNKGRSIFDAYSNASLVSQYKQDTTSWSARLDYMLGPVFSEGWNLGLGFSSDRTDYTLASGPALTTVQGSRRNAVQSTVGYRFLDNHITWITGTLFDYRLDVAHSALGSTLNVYRHTASLRLYLPLNEPNTLDIRIDGGGATGKVLQDGLFDIGGGHQMRGYWPGELQGTYYAYGTVEGRFPISSGGNFALVGFSDIGNIWNHGQSAFHKSVIVGVGMGARLTLRWLVHGIFRADAAYGVATKKWRFYFGTGQAF